MKNCVKGEELFGSVPIKLLLKMKLTFLVILIVVFQSFAGNTLAQGKISVEYRNVTIEKILLELENQFELGFMYNKDLVDVERKVDINMKDASIDEILKELFFGENVTFHRVNNQIVISPKFSVLQQQKSISGKVTDNSGSPLPGVTVIIKGTTNGTVTNADGEYSLSNIPDDAVLQFSFVGMRTQEIAVSGKTTIDVKMEEDAIGIEEVVAVGYGTMKKSDLTGAVTRVNVEELSQLPNLSVIEAMQGTLPGLNIGAVDEVGEDPTMTIRGQNTLSSSASDNAPLVVVDGIIYRGNIVDLNTSDIESVDVLKDISSTAIYGSQASNGVIIITTKRGKENRKPVISYQGSFTLQVPSNKLEPMNGDELAMFLNDVYWAEGSRFEPDYLEADPDFDFTPYLKNSEMRENYENGIETDWWDLLTRNGYINSHNLSLTGRTESVSYFLSGGISDVAGYMENDDYTKINYRINIDAEVNKWMRVGLESFFTSSDYSGVAPSVSNTFTMYPWAPIYDEDGEYALTPDAIVLNPYLQMQQDDSDKRNNLFANIHSDIKLPFIKGLNYRINFSQNYRTTNQDRFNPWGESYTGYGYKNSYINYDWSLDNIVSYKKTIKEDHKIDVTLVYGVEKSEYSYTEASAQGFTNTTLGYNRLQAGDASLNTVSSGKEKETSLYSMGRIIYNFKNRYLVTGTVRRDGFSGFGTTKKIGVFPSIALGWVMSEENFLKNEIDWLNYLKLRGSYGSSGRRGVNRYDTQAIVESESSVVYGDGGSSTIGQWISSLANDNLGWETTTGINLGIDFGLYKSRVHGNIEYYNNNTKDILYDIELPTMTGFSSISTNIGKVHNWGLEFSLTGQIIQNSNFKWESSISFSRNRNKIVSILGADNDQDGDGKEDDITSNELFIGEPQNVNYNYEVVGMWQLEDDENGTIPDGFYPGTYKLADLNDDDEIDSSNDKKILGYTDPSYRMGITNRFSYKNFSLYIFINTIQGGKKYYQSLLGFENGTVWAKADQLIYNNAPKGAWDYWMPENPNAKFRRPDLSSTYGANTGPYFQRNFIRLQDVSFSYTFNKGIIKKLDLSSAKIFISGKNLLTLTKWDGWDPETGTGFEPGRPVMSSYTLGFNVEF